MLRLLGGAHWGWLGWLPGRQGRPKLPPRHWLGAPQPRCVAARLCLGVVCKSANFQPYFSATSGDYHVGTSALGHYKARSASSIWTQRMTLERQKVSC